jgi:hypothetical protein
VAIKRTIVLEDAKLNCAPASETKPKPNDQLTVELDGVTLTLEQINKLKQAWAEAERRPAWRMPFRDGHS